MWFYSILESASPGHQGCQIIKVAMHCERWRQVRGFKSNVNIRWDEM